MNDPQQAAVPRDQRTAAADSVLAPENGHVNGYGHHDNRSVGAPVAQPLASGDTPPSLEQEIRREQQAVDLAYRRVLTMRESALDVVRHHRELGQTTSGQARVEWESLLALTDQRLQHLELGGAALCFGRLDREDGETYQVGRLSVLDESGDPLVIDWRAPVAEPFYRATGLNPMGLVRRRHLLTRGRTVIGLDDEVFDLDRVADGRLSVVGEGALMASLERSRTGRMGDIVATIQAEQDEIIRAPIPGILIVQGGPGTGKTAVALHRAAYLLYTNRQRLEDAGVLVIGPNRTFLRYIEHVLPSLGESGVQLVTIDGLADRLRYVVPEAPEVERIKGDARMASVIAQAIEDRQRPLPEDLVVPYGARNLRVRRDELQRIVSQVAGRRGTHNARRATFVKRLKQALWRQQRRIIEQRLTRLPAEVPLEADDELDPLDVIQSATMTLQREEQSFMSAIGQVAEVRVALERMWPLLTPEQLLNDLFGAPGLLRLATQGVLRRDERTLLQRPRSAPDERPPWSSADLALLDEAAVLLGPLPSARRKRGQLRDNARWMIEETIGDIALQTGDLDPTMRRQLIDRLADRELAAHGDDDDDGIPAVFGHVIVDEAQDLSAMQWRMIARRCTIGSMTIVGDLGQASRPGAISSWEEAVAQLPVRRTPRTAQLTVNYRTPTEIMDVAAGVLAVTDPDSHPPRSVRRSGTMPQFVRCDAAELNGEVARQVEQLRAQLGEGKIAVIAPQERLAGLSAALGRPKTNRDVLEADVGLFSATDAKGLEFDAVVLVEPAAIAGDTVAGLRGLYVALTRATRRLTVVYADGLPGGLRSTT